MNKITIRGEDRSVKTIDAELKDGSLTVFISDELEHSEIVVNYSDFIKLLSFLEG